MLERVQGSGLRVTIALLGIEHLDFSDDPLWNA
jgi:hypothetical protein